MEGKGWLFISLREAGRSAHLGGPHRKSTHPHHLSKAGWSSLQAACLPPAAPSPPGQGRFSFAPLDRDGEASQAGHCDLRLLQEAVSDMPGTGTPAPANQAQALPSGIENGDPLPYSLRATAR